MSLKKVRICMWVVAALSTGFTALMLLLIFGTAKQASEGNVDFYWSNLEIAGIGLLVSVPFLLAATCLEAEWVHEQLEFGLGWLQRRIKLPSLRTKLYERVERRLQPLRHKTVDWASRRRGNLSLANLNRLDGRRK